jgi:hypothetical protein
MLTQASRRWENGRMSEPAKKPHGRWFQFRLRTLLGLMTLIIVGLVVLRAYIAPYQRQLRTLALVERMGGRCTTFDAPAWVRRIVPDARNIDLVDLANCDHPEEYIASVAELPHLASLVVGGPGFTDDHLRRLQNTDSLVLLILDSTSVTEERVKELQATLPELQVYRTQRRLSYEYNRRNPNSSTLGARTLGDPPGFPEGTGQYFVHVTRAQLDSRSTDADLEEACQFDLGMLSILDAKVTDVGVAHLRKCKSLSTLHITGTALTDVGMEHFGVLKNVDQLILKGHPQISGPGLVHLGSLATLQWLGINDSPLGDAGLAHLKPLSNLRVLHLQRTRIQGPGLLHLGAMSALHELNLNETPLTDAGIPHLKQLSKLQNLILSKTRITDAAMEQIGQMSELRFLDLSGSDVSDAGLRSLQNMPDLCVLNLSNTQITDNGLEPLTGIKALYSLDLRKTKVSARGIALLRETKGRLKVDGP